MDQCPGNGQSSAVSQLFEVPKLQVPTHINGKAFTLELDTAAGGNFISTRFWTELGMLRLPWIWTLPPVEISFLLASGQS